ncbi:CPBP family glutamic-type intramembrane protease [Antarcticibacterium sp. 1MA-6-2]|uniref:CPBP family glutamic-type intramembrane protease n=1 Tax=Antarcticibacterium sp. 1MA-6-2 TaxID=2908210 RepID=UPI001F32DF52|nr:CPBP family glutamic-type intramembrane protease [Antarcticibacterium sp. 1MA-6-2]UJH92649.1 CPBP family glutamic-type intramembrane protease [Antarcticibacterium sp. 1MA-6-2]
MGLIISKGINYFIKMLKEFSGFLKTGKTTDKENYFKDFFILFLIVFTIGILISLVKAYFYDLNIIDEEDFDSLNWGTFFSYVIVVPFIEEIIFRAPLVIPRSKIYSGLISLVLIFSSIIYLKNEIASAVLIILVIIIQILYLFNSKICLIINDFIKKYYLALIYLTSISFGLLHMLNYEAINVQTFISIIGRTIGGFYFAFIISKYSFSSSYLLHGKNNVIPFLVLVIAN